MEWCRMYTLRVFVCMVLLWCGLTSAVPDTKHSGHLSISERQHKLQELLKSLDAYSTETHSIMPQSKAIMPSVKNYSAIHESLPTAPGFLKLPENKTRVLPDEPAENFVPNSASIKSYEDFYRVFYGTQEGVNMLRKKYGPTGLQQARAKFGGVNRDLDDVRLANDHFLRIRNRARCRAPVPQVVRVKDYYPDPSREYLPRCTLLHRCGDDTGCCDSDAFHCVPSAIQEVTLHFYTLTVGRNGIGYKAGNGIEKLLFVNHTSCHCQPVNDLPRIQDGLYTPQDGEQQQEEDPPAKSKCRECPVPFTSRIYNDGRCGCDCFDRQKPCIRIKRGKEPLSDIERRCVEANHCHIPDCEYGLYNHRSGYCPRRHDEDQREPPHHRRPLHASSSTHRWAFLERD